MKRHGEELVRLARRYRDAEAHIVKSFFKKRRTSRDHLRWLRAQAFKEYSAIRPIFTAVAELYPELDRGIDRHDFEELAQKLADETRHARLVMDLVEQISGKKVTFRALLWLTEDRKLAKVRARYSRSYATLLHGDGTIKANEIRRKDEQLERATITLTEGGGGALYRVCTQLKKSGIEGKIAHVFREILADELEHKDSGGRTLASVVKSESDFRRAAEIIAAVCSQRLRMRNEQFGFPLTEKELSVLEERARRSLPRL